MVADYDKEDTRGILHDIYGKIVFDKGIVPDIEIETYMVRGLIIDKDYHKNFMPVMFINLLLSDQDAHVLSKYRGYYNFEIGIESSYTAMDSDMKEAVGEQLFFGSFRAEMSERPIIEDGFTNSDGSRDDQPEGTLLNYETGWFLLMDQSVLESNKIRVDNSAPYTDLTVGDVCATMLTSYKSHIPIQFDEPDNITVYEQILISNKNLRNSIVTVLQNGAYGIYCGGVLLFCDLDMIYLMSKWGVNGLGDDDPKIVTINLEGTNDTTPNGVIVTDEKNPIVLATGNGGYKIEKHSLVDEVIAPVIIHYSSDSFNDRVKFDNDNEVWEYDPIIDEESYDRVIDRDGILPRKDYIFADNGNIISIKAKHEEGRHRTLLTVSLTDSEPAFFKPNLKYNMCFDNDGEQDLFGGEYKIARAIHYYIKGKEKNSLRCKTIAVFR